ncbi:unnamed protein product [Nyctereutes procyonoides]|uniref:Platelet-derived growth factor D n=1 Tax=Nyctereutes procyonoides TaxID=34880 RepID=A0A811ZMM5_NYCPR|nr:unnamed protein product [Nyctereutes procyonoides]
MDSANNPLCAHPFGNASPPAVHQPYYITSLGTSLAHDSHLGSRVHEGLQRMSIHFAVDIEHGHLSETFWSLLHRYVHIFLDVLLPDFFFYFGLSFQVKWVGSVEAKPLLLSQGPFSLLLHEDMRKCVEVPAEQGFGQGRAGCSSVRPRPRALPLQQHHHVTVSEAIGAQGAAVVGEEPLHEDDLDLIHRDARLELTKEAEVVQFEVRVDLEGEGRLGQVPPHTVHGDQHDIGPGRPDGHRASGYLYRRDETVWVTGTGHVQSPRFPSSYPRNLLLTWRLHSQERTRIQLAFDPQFGLEEAENDICRYDFVEVEDVSETSTIIRGRWCGHKEVPPRITSRTNQIKITFKSDDYFVAKPGFKIYYSFVEDFQPAAASETNWESVTSSISGVSYHSPSVTDPTLTADALDKTVAEFDTVEDLLKHFNPESWQEDLENLYLDTPHYRGRSYHDRKSKVDLDRLNDDVKRYSCTPRNYSVNLREELKLTHVVFFPRCLLVQRCGGNCGCGTINWKSCTCTSGKTVKKYHEVLKFEPGHFKRRGRAKHMALVDIQLDHHERCDCICSSRPPR